MRQHIEDELHHRRIYNTPVFLVHLKLRLIHNPHQMLDINIDTSLVDLCHVTFINALSVQQPAQS